MGTNTPLHNTCPPTAILNLKDFQNKLIKDYWTKNSSPRAKLTPTKLKLCSAQQIARRQEAQIMTRSSVDKKTPQESQERVTEIPPTPIKLTNHPTQQSSVKLDQNQPQPNLQITSSKTENLGARPKTRQSVKQKTSQLRKIHPKKVPVPPTQPTHPPTNLGENTTTNKPPSHPKSSLLNYYPVLIPKTDSIPANTTPSAS